MAKTQQLNPQIFTVWSDEIEGRIDPFYYRPEFIKLGNQIEKLKFDYLDNIVNFSHETWNQKDIYDEVFPYIEISAVCTETGEIRNVVYLSKNDAPSRAKMIVRKDDIIISTTRPHRGAIARIDNSKNNFIASTGFAVLRELKNKKIQRNYLFEILRMNFCLNQMLQRSSGGNYPAITEEELKKIKIPLPLLEIQNKIVSIMQKAHEENRQKETEAQELLDSINDYVLGELGIKIPEIKKEMVFEVWSDEIENKRIDPKAYLAKPKVILKSIRGSEYKTKELSKIVIESIAGEWGSDPLSTENMEGYVLCNVLRNTNFDNRFNLNFDNVAQRLLVKTKFNKVRLKLGDILIEKSGGSPIQPVGRVALIEKGSQEYAFSNFLQCFRTNQEECLSEYLFAYLKAIYSLGYMEYVQNQTTGIKNLIMEEYLSIPIPLPSLLIQNKIAEGARFRREKAKKLQQEAKEILKKAKNQVEQILK